MVADAQQLVDALSTFKLEGTLPPPRTSASLRCQIEIWNDTHPADNIIVVAGGIKFFFRDGKDETVGPYTLNLRGGQKKTIWSTNDKGCVFRYFVAMTCVIDGNTQNLTYDAPPTPKDCLIRDGVVIRIKRIRAPGDREVLELVQG